jgi:branched-chain amino acid aminotransferase
LTGTTKKVMPVISVGNQLIGTGKPGPVTAELLKMFEDFEKAYVNSQKLHSA